MYYYLNRIKTHQKREKICVVSMGVRYNVSGDEVFGGKENDLLLSQFLLQTAVSP